MREPDKYTMLIAGLPAPESLFAAKRPPLSRLRLDQRLRVLTEEDAETLRLVENALSWRQLSIATSEDDVIKRGREALNRIKSTTLQQIVRDRLELRTCIAALRRRARGEAAPVNKPWGFGRWVNHIVRNWTDPGFRLDNVFNWLREADRLIKQDDAYGLETIVLQQSYKQLQRAAGTHIFDLEAVVIYVLKWNIVDRVTRYNAEAATRRFNDLIQLGLGEYASLSFAGESG